MSVRVLKGRDESLSNFITRPNHHGLTLMSLSCSAERRQVEKVNTWSSLEPTVKVSDIFTCSKVLGNSDPQSPSVDSRLRLFTQQPTLKKSSVVLSLSV